MFALKPAYCAVVRFAERMGMANRQHGTSTRTHV